MRRRGPAVAALSYLLFASLALTGVGIITRWALESSAAERRARARAELEENVRLVLWRMDSQVAAILAAENARAPRDYGLGAGGSRSPLQDRSPPFTQLYFQLEDGTLSSPQVPTRPGDGADPERWAAARDDLARLRGSLSAASIAEALAEKSRQTEAVVRAASAWEQRDRRPGSSVRREDGAAPAKKRKRASVPRPRSKGAKEYAARAQKVKQAFEYNAYGGNVGRPVPVAEPALADVMAPVWVQDRLLLVRRVRTGAREVIQGVWLDWPALEASLLEAADDLLAGARLVPRPGRGNGRRSRLLASLPVELAPGVLPPGAVAPASPWGWVIGLAWAGVVAALIAFGVLLRGAQALSERRATFVSAVTHELRTPLTTFRMYTEMLSAGMVGEEKRDRYLETLRREAVRLGHLVENVLAYARLEKADQRIKRERARVGGFLDRVVPRLEERVEGARGRWSAEVDDRAADATIDADLMAIEQVLFNLVDNAAKYGLTGDDRRVDFSVRLDRGKLRFRVADGGPGVRPSERKKLFRPFTKSAAQAASTAPGVGLGLALSRQLARAHRGDIVLERRAPGTGAAFVLELPTA